MGEDEFMEEIDCVFCTSSSAELVIEGPDCMFGGSEVFRLMRCRGCGALYLNPRPLPSEIGHYYPSDYAPYNVEERSSTGIKQWLRSSGTRKRCGLVSKLAGQSGRILDVGCSAGEFLSMMHQLGNWEVWGVELNEQAAATASQKGITVFNGDLLQSDFPDAHFDVVTLWDVIEHVYKPVETIAESFRILKPGGVLVLRTPNPDSVNRHLFGAYWGGWDLPRHLYIFSIRHLSEILTQCGFESVKALFLSGTYADFVISLRFRLNDMVKNEDRRILLNKALRSLLLQILLFPYAWLTERLGKGAHVTMVARRPL
jgi:2-polyprenyl-3-methyl-5-hydroxy-6-metoxy-1,4-benzoquinol methylase